MDKFYVIKLINNRSGIRGFVSVIDNQIVVTEQMTGKAIQFSSFKEAKDYIRTNKLERNGISCLVYSSEELIDTKQDGLKPLKEEVFYVRDIHGGNVFFNNQTSDYYIDSKEVGFCCWKTREDAENFIKAIGKEGDLFAVAL